jgi:hypothetical protein
MIAILHQNGRKKDQQAETGFAGARKAFFWPDWVVAISAQIA